MAILLAVRLTGMLIPPVIPLTVVIRMVNTVLSHRLQIVKATKSINEDVKSSISMLTCAVAASQRKKVKSATKDAPVTNATNKF